MAPDKQGPFLDRADGILKPYKEEVK
jgi:hypothetical protein